MTSSTAPGKAILLGEHAVVYGRPALAVPLSNLTVTASIIEYSGTDLLIQATDLDQQFQLAEADQDNPLAKAIWLTLDALNQSTPTNIKLVIESNLPVAAGLGSGAAVSLAIIRALSQYLESPLRPETQSALAYEVEKLHHGTPSGIDNTVIAHEAPVYFIKGKSASTLEVGQPFHLLIADTGVTTPTSVAVAEVRQRWQKHRQKYENIFDEIGALVNQGRQVIASGDLELLGKLMDHNQQLLIKIGVSSPELDSLVGAARRAGALGAKLSGGGMGGNMIALVTPTSTIEIQSALEAAGATRVLQAQVTP